MATRAKELSDLGNLKLDVTANGIDVVGVGSNFKSESYNILNLQTDTDDSGSSDDGIFKITNGAAGTTKAEFRWDESEDLVHVSYGDHGRHISIASDGNVGIGTGSTAPFTRAVVGDGSGTEVLTIFSGSGGEGQIRFADATSGSASYQGRVEYDHVNGRLNLGAGGTTPFTINSDGNVGIGTASPVDLSGQSSLTINGTGVARVDLQVSEATTGSLVSESGYIHLQPASGGKAFIGNGGTDLVVDSAGNVGIGTANPSQTLDVNGTAIAEQYLLDAIDKDLSSVTSAIFIYDTSKDSDGGAWRKRTQHTSWYNETLNTSTRGARKEFPAVAVIVAEGQKVTIYDGDDSDVPMWMEFNVSGGTEWQLPSLLCANTVGCNGIAALNGIITSSSSPYGYRYLNFISERSEFRELGYYRLIKRPIIDRNATNNIDPIELGNSGHLPADACHDVAMTVLPEAPIDSTTGLPVPTIAVATASGVGVINDDDEDAVIKITSSSGSNNYWHGVSFSKDNKLWTVNDYNSTYPQVRVLDIPTADKVVNWQGISVDHPVYYIGEEAGWNIDLTLLGIDSSATILDRIEPNAGAIASNYGLNIVDTNLTEPSEGSVAYITSNYNTGHMVGDIKLATLSDTRTTSLSGTNRCAADDFSSGWTVTSGSNMSIGSNVLSVVDTSNVGSTFCDQNITTIVGQEYVIDVTATGTSGTGIGLYVTGYGGPVLGYQWEPTYTFTATTTSTTVRLYRFEGHTGSGTISSIIIKEAAADRSVNGNGVQVFGTVNKTVVATGADLVGYSGWSQSGGAYSSGVNYLHYPNTIALGTSDFHFAVWLKFSTDGGQQTILSSMESDGQYAGPYISTFSSGTVYMGMYTANQANATQTPYQIANGAPNIADNTWHQAVFTKSGTNAKVYIDGEFTVESNSFYSTTATFDKMDIGANYRPFNGSIALLRLSATAPTAEQIKKMYNDEKFLFQENAKATLHGTSDAVTALAYDDDKELLHVGTNAGRSVFQGLTRIDNTTDAVGNAISASNGMIAED